MPPLSDYERRVLTEIESDLVADSTLRRYRRHRRPAPLPPLAAR
jgi:hypothetical protein